MRWMSDTRHTVEVRSVNDETRDLTFSFVHRSLLSEGLPQGSANRIHGFGWKHPSFLRYCPSVGICASGAPHSVPTDYVFRDRRQKVSFYTGSICSYSKEIVNTEFLSRHFIKSSFIRKGFTGVRDTFPKDGSTGSFWCLV